MTHTSSKWTLSIVLFGIALFMTVLPLAFAQTLGGYAYNSAPIDYKANNFACNPGDIQTSGTYSGRYNTYWYSYAEAYSNSGVAGSWCQDYSSDKVMAKSGSYLGEDGIDHFQIRYNDHKNAAMKHDKIPVFFENTLAGYGVYYITGDTYGGFLDPSNSGFYQKQVVHCPDGAKVVDHTNFGAPRSSAHLMNNASPGLYDGSGHKWCELNGVAVKPLAGPETGKEMPDFGTEVSMLYRFTVPDASGNPWHLYKAYKVSGSLPSGITSNDWVKCQYGVTGPFLEGVNQHPISPYENETNKNKQKTPHFHCNSQAYGTFGEPILDTVGPPILLQGIKSWAQYSESTCPAGDVQCGGAGTKATTSIPCSRGTFWCQTKDVTYRTCVAAPTCSSADFEPPPPPWTLHPPSNLKSNKGSTPFKAGEPIQFTAGFSATGNGVVYTMVEITVEVSKFDSFSPIDWSIITSNQTATATTTSMSVMYPSGTTALQNGVYTFRMKYKMSGQESTWTVSPETFTVADVYGSPDTCSALTLSTPGNKSTYSKGEEVQYTYKCNAGKAASVSVVLFKPDGTQTTYVTGTNVDGASLGFSTSNLSEGNYTLKACFDASCKTAGFGSVSFTIKAATTTEVPIACDNGKKCPKGSWCSNGQKFYYPTSEITCVAYPMDGNQISAPAGTTECDPADLSCINNGQIVDVGSSSTTKWCARGMKVYSKDGTKVSCVPWDADAPSGFSFCAPSDSKCKSKGDSWKENGTDYFCNNAKKCSLGTGGGMCVGYKEQCPAGTKYCQSTDTNCVEPGEYKNLDKLPTTTPHYWCGGGGMMFYSSTQAYCEPNKADGTAMSMMFTGEVVKNILQKLGSGWGLCNPNQSSSYGKCLEPGQTGKSEDWCAWWPPMKPIANGTSVMMPMYTPPNSPKACPNFDGSIPELPKPEKPVLPPEPDICPMVYTPTSCPPGKILKFSEGKCRFGYCVDEDKPFPVEPPKPPAQCEIGKTCESGSWCSMSKQCYFPDGKITCSSWQSSCPSGTKVCSPNETKCIEPGETGPSDGWCRDSMECFIGEKKFCQPMDTKNPGAVSCPAGSNICPPGDKNCIEPGKTGPISGWCKNSFECYSSDGKEKLCQAWKQMNSPAMTAAMSPMMEDYCPAGYKKCRPDDKNCVEVGETSKPDNKNGWCAGGRQCFKPEGNFSCIKWGDECPKDSKVCRPDDRGCIEPGQSSGKPEGWCGGNAIRCNNSDAKKPGFTCVGVPSLNDPTAWETTACPSGTKRCPTNDSNCLEFGEERRAGAKFSWCSAGMKLENTDGSVKCVSYREFEETRKEILGHPEEVCTQVEVTAYDPASKDCRLYASPCKVPQGWKTLSLNEICQDGKLKTHDDTVTDISAEQLLQFLADERQHLDDLYARLKILPPSVSEAKVLRSKIEDASKLIKKLANETFKKSRKLSDLIADYFTYRSTALKDIDSGFENLNASIEFAFLKRDLEKALQGFDLERRAQDQDSEYGKALQDGISKLKDLLKSAESQSGTALQQITTVIKDVYGSVSKLVSENRGAKTETYLNSLIGKLREETDKLRNVVEEKNIQDTFVSFMLDKLERIMAGIEDSRDLLTTMEISKQVDEGNALVQRLSKFLGERGVPKEREEKIKIKVEEVFAHLEEKLQKRLDELLEKMVNKVEVMVNEALKKVAENVAIVAEKLEKVNAQVKDQLTQSLSNLTSVPANHREEITETKNEVLSKVEDVEKHLEETPIDKSLAGDLRNIMATASTVNWCGEVAETIKSWMTRMNLALETKALTAEQVGTFQTEMNRLSVKNNEECYRIGAAAFRDVPLHEWYYSATEFNKSNDYIKGYADSRGNSTGKFGPADPTLRVEAVAMATRIYGIPLGDTDVLKAPVPGVPPWGVPYVNATLEAGFSFDAGARLDQPITRAEVAKLFAKLGGDRVDLSSPLDSATKYKDYGLFKNDPEAVKAIDALSDLEILKGSGGYFRPDENLVRSEFATINQRVATNLEVKTD